MKSYQLRNISPELWLAFRKRCLELGVTVRERIVDLIRDDVNEGEAE